MCDRCSMFKFVKRIYLIHVCYILIILVGILIGFGWYVIQFCVLAQDSVLLYNFFHDN